MLLSRFPNTNPNQIGSGFSAPVRGKNDLPEDLLNAGKVQRKEWKPPKSVMKKHSCDSKATKKKSWAAQFREFRAYAECVLDHLRSKVK